MKTEALFRAAGLELSYPRKGRASRAAVPGDGVSHGPAFKAEGLEIASGGCVALLGANGSGKTTFLKALNGLLRPSAGHLLFEGEDAFSSHGLRRRSVYLHQSPYILAGTVSYNVLFGARSRGFSPAESARRARSALRLLGLEGFERRGYRALSGGEAQRVALARALASGADVLLLDEPTASADAESAALVVKALRSRLDEGATIVFSTHDPAFAESLATRTLFLEAGKLFGAECRGRQEGEHER
jgi:ABC-type multidrug transport system ATPase subunit